MYRIFFLFCYLSTVFCKDQELILKVEALNEDCFFEHAAVGDQIVVEYEVMDGGHGEFDISFSLTDPTGRILLADFKKGGEIHSLYGTTDGDYKFCFDNTFSTFNTKTVYFELDIYNKTEKSDRVDPYMELLNQTEQGVANINNSIRNVKEFLNLVEVKQKIAKVVHAKGRNLAEEIFFRVNAFSSLVLTVMIFASFIQIFMVKGIFDDQSFAYRILSFFDFK